MLSRTMPDDEVTRFDLASHALANSKLSSSSSEVLPRKNVSSSSTNVPHGLKQ